MQPARSTDFLNIASGQRLALVAVSFFLGMSLFAGCGGYDFQSGKNQSACVPGEEHCVCDARQMCEAGLTCIADRCVRSPDDAASTQEDSDTPSDSQSTQPQPEPTEDGGDAGASSSAPNDSAKSTKEGSNSVSDASDQPDPELDEARACRDGVRNHRESDTDCGGPVCPGCQLSQRCLAGADCQSQVCAQGRCVQCETDDHCQVPGGCATGRCLANACVLEPKKEGAACDDQDPCTAKDQCQSDGKCVGRSTLVIDEHFDNNDFRWRTMYANREGDARSMWKLGKARASDCGDFMGDDPAQDHTQNGHNTVAGVVIGGCHTRQGSRNVWDCLWSKDFRVSHFDEPVVVSFWRHLHSPAAQARGGVTNRVVYRVSSYPDDIHDLDRGYTSPVDDKGWIQKHYLLPSHVRSAIAVGICYEKMPGAPDFAGWSIDDFKIRQRGCLMKQ